MIKMKYGPNGELKSNLFLGKGKEEKLETPDEIARRKLFLHFKMAVVGLVIAAGAVFLSNDGTENENTNEGDSVEISQEPN